MSSAPRPPASPPAPPGIRVRGAAASVCGLAALALSLAPPAQTALPSIAAPPTTAVSGSTSSNTSGSTSGTSVQAQVDALVGQGRFPGALAAVTDREGHVTHHVAGTGNLRTGAPVPANGQVRIGSASKMFTAAVVLQLAAEGAIDLDAPVDTYLPGVVRGAAFRPREITVRQLLQHTSGLPDHTEVMFTVMADLLPQQHRYYAPRDLVDLALTETPAAPGAGWAYSNTGYVLAGLIAQKVTGRPLHELITQRVIRPAGLRDTYVPRPGEQRLRGPHARGYQLDPATKKLVDFTVMDPSWGWGAGEVVSTPADLTTFLRALLGGKVLPPAQLAEMKRTVELSSTEAYGLGLFRYELSCGGTAWGHGGDIPGYSTRDAVAEDGRAVVVVTTALAGSVQNQPVVDAREGFVDAVLCGAR